MMVEWGMILVPALLLVGGGALVYVWRPGKGLVSAAQHFAAGVVFAAVAIELLPQVVAIPSPVSLTVGFLLGLATMLGVKEGARRLEGAAMPLALLVAIGVDLGIDGLLISIASAIGERDGILVAVALAIEIFFLGFSTSTILRKKGITPLVNMGIMVILGVMIFLGFGLGNSLYPHLSREWMHGFLSFGVAALLYLVTEELLVEAHEVEDTSWITAAFFLGFLAIILLNTQF